MTKKLWAVVIDLLVLHHWSPEQIAGRLRLEGVVSVSAKWIYNYIWADRAAGGTLFRNLRRRGKKPCRRGRDGSGRGVIPGRADISERPGEVEEKSRVGRLGGGHHNRFKTPGGVGLPGGQGIEIHVSEQGWEKDGRKRWETLCCGAWGRSRSLCTP